MHEIRQRHPGSGKPSRPGIKFVDMRSHSGCVTSDKLHCDAVVVDTSKGKEIEKYAVWECKGCTIWRLFRVAKKCKRAKPSAVSERFLFWSFRGLDKSGILLRREMSH